MTTVKSAVVGIISFLAVVGFSTPATTYAWVGDMTFSNIGNIYMPGYTVSSGVNSIPGMQYAMPMHGRQNYGGHQAGGWSWTTSTYPARAFDPLHDTFPTYGSSYGYGGYGGGYGYDSYSYSPAVYGQYPSVSYDPFYGYSAAFGPAYPTGDTDFSGTPLCQWYDYSGATPCSYDPHQWVYDPYTGSWY